MQCTVPTTPSATPARTPWAVSPVSPRSLIAAFAHIPDPRRARSVTYALPALLALAVAAILSNHLSVLAIAEWGARQSPDLLRTLGFGDGRTPCQSTLQRLFSKLDGHALSAALGAPFAPAVVPVPAADEADATAQGVAVDGKAQRGRLPFQQGGCPVHALSAFCPEHGVVLAQEPIEPGQGAEKGAAALTGRANRRPGAAGARRLARAGAHGRGPRLPASPVPAGARGGRRLRAAGQGEPAHALRRHPPALRPAPQPGGPALARPAGGADGRAWTRAAGRRAPAGRLDRPERLGRLAGAGPSLPPASHVARARDHQASPALRHHQPVYGITSLSPQTGPSARLLALKRGHWVIENGLHRVKDVTLGEDHSLIHQGQGPTAMALLRDAAVSLLRRAGVHQIAARLRYQSHHPAAAVALLVDPLFTHA